jgi:hypothetical protein
MDCIVVKGKAMSGRYLQKGWMRVEALSQQAGYPQSLWRESLSLMYHE